MPEFIQKNGEERDFNQDINLSIIHKGIRELEHVYLEMSTDIVV